MRPLDILSWMPPPLGGNRLCRGIFVFVLIGMLMCLDAGCRAKQHPSGPPEKITLAYVMNTGAVLVHISFIKGYFTEEGLDVMPQPHSFGKVALQSVLDGKADLATVEIGRAHV
jgi:ABC-type nitrate/sulfonate/bicarbonate transport system substrate-binding protein